MIKKLRIKLVLAAMISLLIVLTAIIGIAALVNYQNIVSQSDHKLQILTENGEVFPKDPGPGDINFSPETPFEMRYFSVVLNNDNTVQAINTSRIASVDNVQAENYAEEIINKGTAKGFIDSYRYLVYEDAYGVTRICFLFCYRELDSFYSFLQTSVIVSIFGSVAVLLLLILLSRRIVKPVSESYEKQKRFITDAGHELKTPLTIISADTEVLEMDYGENDWLDDIRTQTKRLTALTNSLVFLARMEEQPNIEKVEFSLSEAALDAAENFRTVAKTNGKTLTCSVEPDLTMKGDENTIRRLMAIFLDNAVKYTNENGTILLTADKYRGQIRLQFFNTTDHIKKDTLPHLFDRFYRTDSSRNSETGGYGLGLSIASAIVSSHNGRITASTEDERSLLITVTFPI